MAGLVGEAVDLVLHAWAIAGPHPFDLAGEHRAAVEAGADDRVGSLIGVSDPAWQLRRMHGRIAHEAENGNRPRVARLLLAFRKVDGAAVQPRRRSRLQARLRQLQLLQPRRQRQGRRIPRPPRLVIAHADMNASVQEGARGQHHCSRSKTDADLGDRADNPITLHHQVVDGLLEQGEVRLVLQTAADRGFVEDPIRLRAGGPHGGPLARVQNPELDAAFVGCDRHGAAQRVHLFHQVPLADPADRRVAAHLAEGLDVVGQQQRLATHARSSQGSLGTGVATTDHDDVEFFWVEHGVRLRRQARAAWTKRRFYRRHPFRAEACACRERGQAASYGAIAA